MTVAQTGAGLGSACSEDPIGAIAESGSSRVIFIRDNDSGEYWSVGHFPCQKPFESFQAVHGLGYSTISSSAQKIDSTVTFFVPSDDACELWQIKIGNTERKKRRLSIFIYIELPPEKAVESQLKNNALFITTKGGPSGILRYLAMDRSVDSFDTDPESFIGPYRSSADPKAVEDGKCERSQVSANPIAVLQRNITLGANGNAELLVVAGALSFEPTDSSTQSRSGAIRRAETVIEKYRRAGSAERALEQSRHFWAEVADNISVNSPDEALNTTAAVWAKYQTVSSFLDGGGAGTALACQQLIAVLPLLGEAALKRLEQLLSLQHKDGQTGRTEQDIEGACWLIIAGTEALNETGSTDWLKKQLPYGDSGSSSALEHLIRAAEHIIDNFNERALAEYEGRERTVESSLAGYALKGLIPLLEAKAEHHLVTKYSHIIERLSRALSNRMWDGGWYLAERNHRKVGSKKSSYRKIDLAAQLWPALGSLAAKERLEKALNNAWHTLGTPSGLAEFLPPYPRYEPADLSSRPAVGERSNGGINLRLAALAILAECKLGRGDLAYRAFQEHCPIYRSGNQNTFKTEPFAYPGYIFGPGNARFGRGDLSWDELSGSWTFSAILKGILGAQPVLNGLKIDPCIPRDWRQVEYSRRFRGAEYHIRIINPTRQSSGVDRVIVDGIRQTGNVIKPFQAGSHYIEVYLG